MATAGRSTTDGMGWGFDALDGESGVVGSVLMNVLLPR